MSYADPPAHAPPNAWEVAKLENHYRLIETTLERPIRSLKWLPVVDINKCRWDVYDLVYVPWVMIRNKDELWINEEVMRSTREKTKYELRIIDLFSPHYIVGKKVGKRELEIIRKVWTFYC